MVRFILFFLVLTITMSSLSQTKEDSIPVFSHPEEYPIFDKNYPNNIEKLYEFFVENLKYPESAKADRIEGQVQVLFWIDTNGSTSEHKIIQSVRQDLDDEVLRVAKLIKFDVPAKNGGIPVKFRYSLPFRFTLNEDKPTRKRKY